MLTLVCAGAGVGNSTYYNNNIYNYTTLGGCLPGDYLEISDGSSTQRYSCTSTPAPLTSTNTITVKLHIDYNGVSGGGMGFLATACCSVAVTTDVSTGEWWL